MFISTPRFHRGRDSVRECNNEKRNLYKHNNEYPPSVPLLYKYENPQHTYVQALLRSLLSFQLWPWAQRGAAATTALHAATGALQQGGWQSFLPTLEAFAPVPEKASASLRGGPAAVSTPAKTRVRYRAQGLADNRCGKKATHKQLRTSTLARPFQAAHGVPPERRRR